MAVPGDPQDNVLNTDFLKLFPTLAEEGADDCRSCLQYVLTEPYLKERNIQLIVIQDEWSSVSLCMEKQQTNLQ